MTSEITPPPELFKQWEGTPRSLAFEAAYRAGADAELEACCEQLRSLGPGQQTIDRLRTARRPKPLSLKEAALKELKDWTDEKHGPGGEVYLCEGLNVARIRNALEQLDD
jgi:hypothetical protein